MTNAVSLAQQASTGVSQGFKNRIINGAMVIAQRGTSAVTTSGSYPVDRFAAISNASDFTSIQNTTVPSGANFVYSVSIQPTSTKTPSAGTYAAITTNVEGLNMQGLGWGSSSALPITVSFWVRSSKTGTYSVSTKNAGANRSWCQEYTINAANTWEFKSYTITGCPDGSWPIDNTRGMTFDFWLAGQNTQTSTIGSWISGNANMSSNQVNFFDNTSNVFYITGVQAEVGSTATSFDTRSYGTELQLCQRYYYSMNATTSIAGSFGGGVQGPTRCDIVISYPVEMRATPTFSITGTPAIDDYYAVTGNVGSVNAQYMGNKGGILINNMASGSFTQGRPVKYSLPNTGLPYSLNISAEL